MLEATLTKVELSFVITDHDWIDEGLQQPVRVNLRRFICLLVEFECSEGATRNLIETDFPKESKTIVTINDISYMFVLCVQSIGKTSL